MFSDVCVHESVCASVYESVHICMCMRVHVCEYVWVYVDVNIYHEMSTKLKSRILGFSS